MSIGIEVRRCWALPATEWARSRASRLAPVNQARLVLPVADDQLIDEDEATGCQSLKVSRLVPRPNLFIPCTVYGRRMPAPMFIHWGDRRRLLRAWVWRRMVFTNVSTRRLGTGLAHRLSSSACPGDQYVPATV